MVGFPVKKLTRMQIKFRFSIVKSKFLLRKENGKISTRKKI